MEENREIIEKFLKNESQTELDAIHPRFMEPLDAKVIREYEIRNRYYCESCKQFFAATVEGLKTHFSGDIVEHRPYASCFYCAGNVYEYKFNNERKLHHDCRDARKEREKDS